MLISLSLFRNLSPENSLSICNTPEDFGQGAVEDFRPFSVSWWVFSLLRYQFFLYELFCLWRFCSGLASNACFSVASKVLATELYSGFWDVLSPRGVLIGFEKLLSLGFWSYHHFARRSSS